MTSKDIKRTVERLSGMDLSKKNRKREFVYARYIYFKVAKDLTTDSLYQIGKVVNRDHATVIHGIKNIRHAMSERKFLDLYNRTVDYLCENSTLYSDERESIIEDYKASFEQLQAKYETVLKAIREQHKDPLMMAMMEMSEDDKRTFTETRLKPFLLMKKQTLK